MSHAAPPHADHLLFPMLPAGEVSSAERKQTRTTARGLPGFGCTPVRLYGLSRICHPPQSFQPSPRAWRLRQWHDFVSEEVVHPFSFEALKRFESRMAVTNVLLTQEGMMPRILRTSTHESRRTHIPALILVRCTLAAGTASTCGPSPAQRETTGTFFAYG